MSATKKLKDTPGSLYPHIATLLRRRINVGEWLPGQQLPTLDDLVCEFEVSRVTVRQAIGLLEAEGLVWRQQGKGTFVAEDVTSGPWFTLESDWSSLVTMVKSTGVEFRKIHEERRTPQIDSSEGELAAAYQYMRRVYCKDGTPFAVIGIHLNWQIYLKARKEFSRGPVIPVLDKLSGITIANAWQTLTIGTADLEISDLLGIPVNAPVVHVRRIIQDPTKTVIYVGDLIYRGDFIKLDINLKK